MSDDTIVVKLFSSTGCYYCVQFKPTWNQLKSYTSYNGVNIKYEEKDIQSCFGDEVKDIISIPTIVFLFNDKEEKFRGNRSLETLKEAINTFIDNRNTPMSGGGVNEYKAKYAYKSLISLSNYYNMVHKSKGIDNEDEEYRLKCLKLIVNMINNIN